MPRVNIQPTKLASSIRNSISSSDMIKVGESAHIFSKEEINSAYTMYRNSPHTIPQSMYGSISSSIIQYGSGESLLKLAFLATSASLPIPSEKVQTLHSSLLSNPDFDKFILSNISKYLFSKGLFTIYGDMESIAQLYSTLSIIENEFMESQQNNVELFAKSIHQLFSPLTYSAWSSEELLQCLSSLFHLTQYQQENRNFQMLLRNKFIEISIILSSSLQISDRCFDETASFLGLITKWKLHFDNIYEPAYRPPRNNLEDHVEIEIVEPLGSSKQLSFQLFHNNEWVHPWATTTFYEALISLHTNPAVMDSLIRSRESETVITYFFNLYLSCPSIINSKDLKLFFFKIFEQHQMHLLCLENPDVKMTTKSTSNYLPSISQYGLNRRDYEKYMDVLKNLSICSLERFLTVLSNSGPSQDFLPSLMSTELPDAIGRSVFIHFDKLLQECKTNPSLFESVCPRTAMNIYESLRKLGLRRISKSRKISTNKSIYQGISSSILYAISGDEYFRYRGKYLTSDLLNSDEFFAIVEGIHRLNLTSILSRSSILSILNYSYAHMNLLKMSIFDLLSAGEYSIDKLGIIGNNGDFLIKITHGISLKIASDYPYILNIQRSKVQHPLSNANLIRLINFTSMSIETFLLNENLSINLEDIENMFRLFSLSINHIDKKLLDHRHDLQCIYLSSLSRVFNLAMMNRLSTLPSIEERIKLNTPKDYLLFNKSTEITPIEKSSTLEEIFSTYINRIKMKRVTNGFKHLLPLLMKKTNPIEYCESNNIIIEEYIMNLSNFISNFKLLQIYVSHCHTDSDIISNFGHVLSMGFRVFEETRSQSLNLLSSGQKLSDISTDGERLTSDETSHGGQKLSDIVELGTDKERLMCVGENLMISSEENKEVINTNSILITNNGQTNTDLINNTQDFETMLNSLVPDLPDNDNLTIGEYFHNEPIDETSVNTLLNEVIKETHLELTSESNEENITSSLSNISEINNSINTSSVTNISTINNINSSSLSNIPENIDNLSVGNLINDLEESVLLNYENPIERNEDFTRILSIFTNIIFKSVVNIKYQFPLTNTIYSSIFIPGVIGIIVAPEESNEWFITMGINDLKYRENEDDQKEDDELVNDKYRERPSAPKRRQKPNYIFKTSKIKETETIEQQMTERNNNNNQESSKSINHYLNKQILSPKKLTEINYAQLKHNTPLLVISGDQFEHAWKENYEEAIDRLRQQNHHVFNEMNGDNGVFNFVLRNRRWKDREMKRMASRFFNGKTDVSDIRDLLHKMNILTF